MSNSATTIEPATVGDVGARAESASTKRIFTSYMFRDRNNSKVVFRREPPFPPPTFETVRRPARVARMLALAHHLQREIENGKYQDRAEVARRFGITRARTTQLLNLTLLAPDIQEAVLHLEAVDGLEPSSERSLREMASAVDWEMQREQWKNLFFR